MEHRFILEPYKGVSSRHSCPNCQHTRCFSKYIDTVIEFPDYVGRCNREQNCGYHFKPKDYFEQSPDVKEKLQDYSTRQSPIQSPTQTTSYIDFNIVEKSMKHDEDNKLFQFLSSQLGETETLKLMQLYKIGTANHWQGASVFWQIDIQCRVRTGKIMLYNPDTGRRVKEPHSHITWVHSLLSPNDFQLKQCFFSEHLLATEKVKPIAIVESEKTTLIASAYLPQYLWIATGGKNGCFRSENMKILHQHNVVLFPDLGATEQWKEKIPMMQEQGIKVELFNYLEENATAEQQ